MTGYLTRVGMTRGPSLGCDRLTIVSDCLATPLLLSFPTGSRTGGLGRGEALPVTGREVAVLEGPAACPVPAPDPAQATTKTPQASAASAGAARLSRRRRAPGA